MKVLNNFYGSIIVLGGILFILAYSCFAERGLVNVLSLQKELAEVDTYNQSMAAENEKLKDYIYLLKNNKRFIENIAREELGLVRDGEILYFFENN